MAAAEKMIIDVQPDEVLNKFIRQYRVAAQSLRYAHAAIRQNSLDELPMLDVDGLAFNVEDQQEQPDSAKQISETDAWLLRSAFIDTISALNESLLVACRILRLHRRAKASSQQPFATKKDAERFLDRIDEELMRKHIPDLMDEIRQEVDQPLPLFDAIASLNKVRNCLVHRNGIVGRKDVNDSDTQVLRFSFLQHQIYVLVNGVEHRLTRALKEQKPIIHALKTEHWDAHVVYGRGTPITLTTDLYNDTFFTCYAFLHHLRLLIYKVIDVTPEHITTEVILVRSKTDGTQPTVTE